MTLEKKVPPADQEQYTFENDADAKRTLLIGKTTSGAYTPIKVLNDGTIEV